MPAVCILKHLDLINHDGRNVSHLLPAADHIVHPFIGADNDRGLGVPVPDLPGLGKVKPAYPGEEPRLCKLPVPSL